jgi:hypothetical protein
MGYIATNLRTHPETHMHMSIPNYNTASRILSFKLFTCS